MKFNNLKHVLDHAHHVINSTILIDESQKPFDTSIDTAYFIANGYDTQEKIDDVMMKIMHELAATSFTVIEKNTPYKYVNAETKDRIRSRIIKFDDILIAYHNQSFDNSKPVNPHLHILFSETSRTGIGFTYLRRALQAEANKFNIKFNFMEAKQYTGISEYHQQRIKRLSWYMHIGEIEKINSFFANEQSIITHLNVLMKHYKNTQNISFFLKIMTLIHERLNELDLNCYYEGINLIEELFFYLCDEDVALMEDLRDDKIVNLNLKNVIDREVLKYAYGFGSVAMDVLIDYFDVSTIFKEQIGLVEYNGETPDKTKSKKNIFRSLVISDMRCAIANANSEKEIKQLLLDTGSYRKVTTKTQKTSNGKRVKIGFEVTTSKKSKMKILFQEMGLNYARVLSVLDNNKKRKRKDKIESKITYYEKKKHKKEVRPLKRFTHKIRTILQLYPTKVNVNNHSQDSNDIAVKYDISRSELYNITTYKCGKTIFVDYGDKITLKKASPIVHQNISDMLDIIEMKGWELTSIQGKGEEKYLKEAGKQIKNRSGLYDDSIKSGLKL